MRIFLLLIVVTACLYAADPTTEVAQAERVFHDASNARDAVALEKLLTGDFLFIQRSGKQLDKQAYLERLRGGQMAIDVGRETIKVRVYSDAAIVTTRDHWNAQGGKVQLIGTRVYIKQNGKWMLASHQATSETAQ